MATASGPAGGGLGVLFGDGLLPGGLHTDGPYTKEPVRVMRTGPFPVGDTGFEPVTSSV
jgi:hypothetical protein